MRGMFRMNAASILVSTGSSLVRILAPNRFSAVASRSRFARSREGMTSVSSVGSGEPVHDRCEPAEHHEVDLLLGQHRADLDRVEGQTTCGESTKRTEARISMSVFVTSTMCRTRSSTDMRSSRRIWLTSTPRQSSVVGTCSMPPAYDAGVRCV